MAIVQREFRSIRKAKQKVPLSLISLLSSDENAAIEAVERASAEDRSSLMAEFIAYHHDCLLSRVSNIDNCLSNIIRFIKTYGFLIDYKLSISKLIEVSSYYENTGDIDTAVSIAEESLGYAESISDQALQRKAYSRLGACYSRQFDFQRSCTCYQSALKLAVLIGDPVFEFAVLANIVTLFDAMGLTREAGQLARRIEDNYPDDDENLALLHLQNCINGFQFTFKLKQFTEMERFHKCASRMIRKVSQVPEIWRAYYEANNTTYLIHKNQLSLAKKRIEKWPKNIAALRNKRVSIIVMAASVECAIAINDLVWMKDLEASLQAALPLCRNYPPDYELALGLLSRVCAYTSKPNDTLLSLHYARRLQEHVVNVRHRQFFKELSRKEHLGGESSPSLENPLYDFAFPATSGCETRSLGGPTAVRSIYKSDEFFLELEGRLLESQGTAFERDLRTAAYCIAENWAVAAEFGSNEDGAHCFFVGILAGKIASAMNFDSYRCVALELACRLHDIGKVGMPALSGQATLSGGWHTSVHLREHPWIGERLLSSSSDNVLTLASKIARSHHEWWNGFGYPDALSGESIAIEARICAVASEYSALVSSKAPQATWSHEEAIKQIATMAGVQFDPLVVKSFLGLMNLESEVPNLRRAIGGLEENRLNIAKVGLDACVLLT